jgi:hypothetical protein
VGVSAVAGPRAQMLLLALLHRWRPAAARRLELLALALPLPDALARLVVRLVYTLRLPLSHNAGHYLD